MLSSASANDSPVFVELQVNHKVRIAAEMAAGAGSKPMSDFLEDILVDYLSTSGYLTDRI